MSTNLYAHSGRVPETRETHHVQHRAARLQPAVILPPKSSDAIRPGTCRRCGITGEHSTAVDCIDALRDRLARWE